MQKRWHALSLLLLTVMRISGSFWRSPNALFRSLSNALGLHVIMSIILELVPTGVAVLPYVVRLEVLEYYPSKGPATSSGLALYLRRGRK